MTTLLQGSLIILTILRVAWVLFSTENQDSLEVEDLKEPTSFLIYGTFVLLK
jgi:hypothetical protein